MSNNCPTDHEVEKTCWGNSRWLAGHCNRYIPTVREFHPHPWRLTKAIFIRMYLIDAQGPRCGHPAPLLLRALASCGLCKIYIRLAVNPIPQVFESHLSAKATVVSILVVVRAFNSSSFLIIPRAVDDRILAVARLSTVPTTLSEDSPPCTQALSSSPGVSSLPPGNPVRKDSCHLFCLLKFCQSYL